MTRESMKKGKGAPKHVKVAKELSKPATINPAQEAELVKRLSEMSAKRQAEDINEALQTSQQMSALWGPYMIPILKQLRKKGVDVDSMRSLLEQIALGQKPTAQREKLWQKLSEQRTKILDAIAEVADLNNLERQVRALVSSGKQISLTTDGVLAVLGRKEDQ